MGALVQVRDAAKMLVEDIADDLRAALPANITLDRFRSTFITAVSYNPDILECDPQTVKTALLKAATDKLLPDNREAAIVPFNTKVKRDNREVWIKAAQYMPMVQGIRKRARELGGVKTITCECVYENDTFMAVMGDNPRIEHEPTKLGKPRGAIIGAYAIFKDENDEVLHREVMPIEDVEKARSVSRAKDGPGWTKFYSEFARKTVVRRGAKSVPTLPDELRTIIERDDDYVDLEAVHVKDRPLDHNPLLEDGGAKSRQRPADETKNSTNTEAQRADVAGNTPGVSSESAPTGDEPGSSDQGSFVNDPGAAPDAPESESRPPHLSGTAEGGAQTPSPVDGGAVERLAAEQSPLGSQAASSLCAAFGEALFRATQAKSLRSIVDQFWDANEYPFDDVATKDRIDRIHGVHVRRIRAEISAKTAMEEIRDVVSGG